MLRATLKSLLAHKLRLVLSAVAVVLGVAFVAGSLIFTDTIRKTFDDLFAETASDVAVTPKPAVESDIFSDGTGAVLTLPASVLEQVERVDGVKDAHGDVFVQGVRLVDRRNKVIGSTNAPGFGLDWYDSPDSPLRMQQGRGPSSESEIAIDSIAAKQAKLKVGDRVDVVLPEGPRRTATISGIFRFGTSGNLAGATLTAFDGATARRLLLGGKDVYTSVSVVAADGVADTELKNRVLAAVGDGYKVQTAAEATDEASKDIQQGLGFISTFLLAFAGVALFVGSFIILNTFSMIVAQRTRELALMRAIGASRRQVTRSVMVEALVVGLGGGLLGVGAGIGLALLLQLLFSAVGLGLSTGGLVLSARTVVVALVVGVVVTLAASYLPARRAAKVPPIAALRDDAGVGPRGLRVRGAIGAVLAALAVAALVGAVNATDGSDGASLLGLGALLALLAGIALSPVVGIPVVRVLGSPLRRAGVVGTLSTENARRNPRRTAATASALMIGLALVTGFGVIASSLTSSFDKLVGNLLGADLTVSSSQGEPFSPDIANRIGAVDGVRQVVRQRYSGAQVDGKREFISAVDGRGLPAALRVTTVSGDVASVGEGSMLVAKKLADSRGYRVGQRLDVLLATGRRTSLPIGAVIEDNPALGNWTIPIGAYEDLGGSRQDNYLYVDIADDADAARVTSGVEQVVAGDPRLSVKDQQQFKDEQKSGINTLLYLVYGLLALAIVIAVLGIVNTLALSVVERTREIGLLRAVGMSRRQLRRMVRWESVLISVFGALLGLGIGIALGVTMQRVLADDGIDVLSIPVGQLVAFVVLAAVIGVLAALWPARRAARLDVLRAITTE